MFVHSILLNGTDRPADPGPLIAHNFDSLRLHHPEAEHRIHTDGPARAFLHESFGPEVVNAWDRLIPLAYRSDLLRYALLHALGGLYVDASIRLVAPLVIEQPLGLHLFRDVHNVAPWITFNGLLAAPPGEPLFTRCIEQICAHVRQGYYGQNPLCPTGPNLLGQTAAQMVPLGSFVPGYCVLVNLTPEQRVVAYFRHDTVVAIQVKANRAGLASLGFKHHDDYNVAWNRRRIYRGEKSASGIARLLGRSPR